MAEAAKHLSLKVKSYIQKIHKNSSTLDFKVNHAISSNQTLTITTAGSLSNGKVSFPANLHKTLWGLSILQVFSSSFSVSWDVSSLLASNMHISDFTSTAHSKMSWGTSSYKFSWADKDKYIQITVSKKDKTCPFLKTDYFGVGTHGKKEKQNGT